MALDALIAARPIEDWKSYLTFRVMDTYGDHLDSTTAAIRFNFRGRTLSGQKEQRERWKRGISLVNESSRRGRRQTLRSRDTFRRRRRRRCWSSSTTCWPRSTEPRHPGLDDAEYRAKSREKLSKFTAKIGYPDVWRDYSGMEIVRGDHRGTCAAPANWEHRRQVAEARKARGPDGVEHESPQTVNAYYNPTQNEVVFPAARLQPPFFQLKADDAINYGAVGGVIGHEISHGFDDQGSRFDGNGNMSNWYVPRGYSHPS